MAGEPNQAKWVGVRPTDPAVNIPVEVKAVTGNTPIIPATPEKIFTTFEPPEGATYASGQDIVVADRQTIFTVGVDTVLYIVSWGVTVNPGAAGWGALNIRTDAHAVFARLGLMRCETVISQGCSGNFNMAYQIPAGYYLELYSSAANVTTEGYFTGYTRPV